MNTNIMQEISRKILNKKNKIKQKQNKTNKKTGGISIYFYFSILLFLVLCITSSHEMYILLDIKIKHLLLSFLFALFQLFHQIFYLFLFLLLYHYQFIHNILAIWTFFLQFYHHKYHQMNFFHPHLFLLHLNHLKLKLESQTVKKSKTETPETTAQNKKKTKTKTKKKGQHIEHIYHDNILFVVYEA